MNIFHSLPTYSFPLLFLFLTHTHKQNNEKNWTVKDYYLTEAHLQLKSQRHRPTFTERCFKKGKTETLTTSQI